MVNQNANALIELNDTEDSKIDLDDLEAILQANLEEELADAEFIDSEIAKVGNPESLGKVVYDTIWEQLQNQIGVKAGEDFIKDNHGLNLDLRSSEHIQTTENFEKGKIATHNHDIDYQKRYNDWKENFQKNDDGSIKTKLDSRSGKDKKVLTQDARQDFDKGRPRGNLGKNTAVDHDISAAEIIRDSEAATHLSRKEQLEFANSATNLNEIDASANQSKSDLTMDEWLSSERNGQKPSERFSINEKELRKKDKQAREEYEKLKNEGKKRSTESGKKSQKEEAKRIGGKIGRAIVLNLLADLVKSIIRKFISWLSEKEKSLKTLLASIKDAIVEFVSDFKQKVISTVDVAITTIASSIFGPVINVIKKAWMFIKQGYNSIKEAIKFLKDPQNKNKPISYKLLEVGKIVVLGLTVGGAIGLGELIEKGLLMIPIFAIEIPLLGSLANIIGIFLGAIVSGLIGALAINLIDKIIAKKAKNDLISKQVDKLNEVISTQSELQVVKEVKLDKEKKNISENMINRHKEAGQIMTDAVNHIKENGKDIEEIDEKLAEINDDLASLLL